MRSDRGLRICIHSGRMQRAIQHFWARPPVGIVRRSRHEPPRFQCKLRRMITRRQLFGVAIAIVVGGGAVAQEKTASVTLVIEGMT